MPSTYTPIATTTLSSTSSTVTFSSIPQTYTDLIVVANSKFTQTSARFISMQYNGDTGSNYRSVYYFGAASSTGTASSIADTSARIGNGSSNNAFGVCVANIFDYTNTTTYKTSIGRAGTNDYAICYMATWKGSTGSATQAINSVTVTCDTTATNAFASGSMFSLYGIKRA